MEYMTYKDIIMGTMLFEEGFFFSPGNQPLTRFTKVPWYYVIIESNHVCFSRCTSIHDSFTAFTFTSVHRLNDTGRKDNLQSYKVQI